MQWDYSVPSRVMAFWNNVEKTDTCWVWVRARNRSGYGRTGAHGAPRLAHRVSYEMAHGAIPDGLMVCHKCDNPPCVRPDHLFLGTAKDNVRDAQEKGRLPVAKPRVPKLRIRPQKLTPEFVRFIRSSSLSARELATMSGVVPHTIRDIRRGTTWKGLD